MITLLPLPGERISAAARELGQLGQQAQRTKRSAYVQAHIAALRADIDRRKKEANRNDD